MLWGCWIIVNGIKLFKKSYFVSTGLFRSSYGKLNKSHYNYPLKFIIVICILHVEERACHLIYCTVDCIYLHAIKNAIKLVAKGNFKKLYLSKDYLKELLHAEWFKNKKYCMYVKTNDNYFSKAHMTFICDVTSC